MHRFNFLCKYNLMKNYGVEQSLYETCHHNIVYGTLNFNIPLPPFYFRKIWVYKNANIGCIQESIYNFDWTRAFKNQNCNKKCKILPEALLNIFHNFIPIKSLDGLKINEMFEKVILINQKISVISLLIMRP